MSVSSEIEMVDKAFRPQRHLHIDLENKSNSPPSTGSHSRRTIDPRRKQPPAKHDSDKSGDGTDYRTEFL